MLHMYYTFHRTDPYEILFKANLNYFATSLDRINEYNLICSSPEKIFDVQIRDVSSDECTICIRGLGKCGK